jgi:pimeloyl-ACP methyl ester carboxylesterase
LATPVDERATIFEAFGVPLDRARALGGWIDEEMAACILTLYRSAVDVGRQWGPEFVDIPAPGLALLPTEDPFLSAEGSRLAAKRAGVDVVELPGLGHWWMLQNPALGASVLSEFWATLP